MDDEPPSFAQLLKRYRQTAFLTQEALAEAAGLSTRGISDLERGLKLAPRYDTVELLANALQLTPEERTAFRMAARPPGAPSAQAQADAPPAPGEPLAAPSSLAASAPSSPEAVPTETMVEPRTNLPASLTSFVGREREEQEVLQILREARLLTLTGTGGVGKTRLSLQVAARSLDHYVGGVWLTELAAITPGSVTGVSLVAQAIAGVLGLREQVGQGALATIVGALRATRALLVLDNCEHLVAACAEVAAHILQRCPGVHILASSRERLGVAGEMIYRVPSLALPDSPNIAAEQAMHYAAVRLFVERARASDPGFAVTPDNIGDILQICARLDGIPLALELAAARVGVLHPGEIAHRLDDRFRLLTGGARTALPRQQTLRAMLDWSYDLLAEPERHLFRRVSVFVGGWTLEAAEVVCAAPDLEPPITDAEALALLINLAEKSLALPMPITGGPLGARFRMLETVRGYALEQLMAAGERDVLRQRHARHFLALAEQAEPELRGAAQAQWLRILDAEQDNLRAALRACQDAGDHQGALRLAGALWRYWYVRGELREGRSWLESLLAASVANSDVPLIVRAKALYGAASLAEGQGDYAQATAFAQEALDLHRATGDQAGIAGALNNLGNVARNQADLPRAAAVFEECLSIWRALDQRQGTAAALNNLGATLYLQGDLDHAEEAARESLEIRRALGDQGGMAIARDTVANVARARGDLDRAIAGYEESLALWREVGDTWGTATALGDLASALCLAGMPDRAEACAQEARALWRTLEDGKREARTVRTLSVAARLRGDLDRAAALHQESLAACMRHVDTIGVILNLEGMAVLEVARQRPQRAAAMLGAAAALRDITGARLPPVAGPERAAMLAQLRAALGEQELAVAWERGAALDMAEAVHYASGEAD